MLSIGGWFFGDDCTVLHGAATVGFEKYIEAFNEIDLLAIENLGEVADSSSLNSLLADLPGLGHAVGPIEVVSNLQTLVRPKPMMDVRSPQQPIKQRGELVVAANGALLNPVNCDHDKPTRSVLEKSMRRLFYELEVRLA